MNNFYYSAYTLENVLSFTIKNFRIYNIYYLQTITDYIKSKQNWEQAQYLVINSQAGVLH